MDSNISLIDVNGSYGCGAYGKPVFPSLTDLFPPMDYLGIERSLVWNIESRDMNPFCGNKNLMQDIKATPGASDRIIPAFVITPPCFYEDETMEYLKEQLSAGQVKALRIFPRTSRFPIAHLERMLEELKSFEPAVFLDLGETAGPTDIKDFIAMAGLFPEISFVFTQMMWGGFGNVMDMMWRQKNISVDISWLHMRNVIELLVKNFSAERVLFGTGPVAHYGAAIAALAHAEISEAERELIAHGNAERLLKLAPAKNISIPNNDLLKKKPLWAKVRSGKPVDDVKIIDTHSHTGPHTRGWFMEDNVDLEINIRNLVKHMDKVGVDRLIICPEQALFGHCLQGNIAVEEKIKPYLDRFMGYLIFNPYYTEEMVPELDNFFSRDFFVGFKILPDYWKIPVTDPGYVPVWEYADKYNLPILIHTWDGKCDSPVMLKDIVKSYPNAVFLLGHSGGGDKGRREAEQLALDNSNVMLEFCGSFTSRIPWEETLAKVGYDRVVFGSDTGAHSLAWELGRFLSTPVPDEKLVPILSENIEKILAKSKLGDLK